MSDPTALWTALGVVATALSTVSVSTYKRLVLKLDACEDKHDAAQKELTDVSRRLGHLEGSVEKLQQHDNDGEASPGPPPGP